jgi:hypothetical protein
MLEGCNLRAKTTTTCFYMLTVAQNLSSGFAYMIEGDKEGDVFYMLSAFVIYPKSYARTLTELMFEDFNNRLNSGTGLFTLTPVHVPRINEILDGCAVLYPLIPRHEAMLMQSEIMRNNCLVDIKGVVSFKETSIQ